MQNDVGDKTAKIEQDHAHHYVPRWYQKRFLVPGQSKYWYLDLHPDTVVSGPKTYRRRDVLPWGPARCFYQDDLYTVQLGKLTSDEIEKRFFGVIDSKGREAVRVFSDYNGGHVGLPEAFRSLMVYMDAQRFRTPQGIGRLKVIANVSDHNEIGRAHV